MRCSFNRAAKRWSHFTVFAFLLVFVQNHSQAQSLFVAEGDKGAGIGATFFSADNLSAAQEFAFSFTPDGRWDLGASYAQFSGASGAFLRSTDFQFFTPQVSYLLVKTDGGFNFGASAGALIGLNDASETAGAYGLTLAQRISKINDFHILPYLSWSKSSISDGGTLGAGIRLNLTEPKPAADIFSLGFGISDFTSDKILAFSLTYIFRSTKAEDTKG